MNVRLRKQEEEKTISPVAESPGTVRTTQLSGQFIKMGEPPNVDHQQPSRLWSCLS